MKKILYFSLGFVSILNASCINISDVATLIANKPLVTPSSNSSATTQLNNNSILPVSEKKQSDTIINNSNKLLKWTDAQYQGYVSDCSNGAIKSNASLSKDSINTFCDCTARIFDQFYDYNDLGPAISSGKISSNDIKGLTQACANKAGVTINNTQNSTQKSSSSSDSDWCNESYENQLVCSGVPARVVNTFGK